jgi:hypothetical protein
MNGHAAAHRQTPTTIISIPCCCSIVSREYYHHHQIAETLFGGLGAVGHYTTSSQFSSSSSSSGAGGWWLVAIVRNDTIKELILYIHVCFFATSTCLSKPFKLVVVVIRYLDDVIIGMNFWSLYPCPLGMPCVTL